MLRVGIPNWVLRLLPVAALVLAIAGVPLLIAQARTAGNAISDLIHPRKVAPVTSSWATIPTAAHRI